MKITIIGSTAYQDKMLKHKKAMEAQGHTVLIPAFDSHPELTALGVCEYNRHQIEQADVIHIFWDQRSMGTVFDFGMVFAMRKPIKIIYMQSKTFRMVMEEYERTLKEDSHGID